MFWVSNVAKKRTTATRQATKKKASTGQKSTARKGPAAKSHSSRKQASSKKTAKKSASSHDSEPLIEHLRVEQQQMLDRIAQIDALLATYDAPADRGKARQTDSGSRSSVLLWIRGALEKSGRKYEELVKRFQESNPGQKLASFAAAAKTHLKRGNENSK
jgi:hypothetical protein